MSRFEFELRGAEVAERGVQTLTIVPTFDVDEDGGASLGTRVKGCLSTFGFERAEKAFHGSIVETIADPAHADLAVIDGQGVLKQVTGVLATLIRVMQQVGGWMTLCNCHIPSLLHQGVFHVFVHRPADHAA